MWEFYIKMFDDYKFILDLFPIIYNFELETTNYKTSSETVSIWENK